MPVINNQEWSNNNSIIKFFNNGDEITHAANNADWIRLSEEGTPAWCWYDDNQDNEENYGILYNWYAIADQRGIAPKGWRVPTCNDWVVLINFLGGYSEAGGHLKSIIGWNAECIEGDNLSGFTAMPGGKRWINGEFMFLTKNAIFWAIDNENIIDQVGMRQATHYDIYSGNGIYPNFFDKRAGFSLRFIRNN
jgi:uncharacterized protein (TIGR02145 family)